MSSDRLRCEAQCSIRRDDLLQREEQPACWCSKAHVHGLPLKQLAYRTAHVSQVENDCRHAAAVTALLNVLDILHGVC